MSSSASIAVSQRRLGLELRYAPSTRLRLHPARVDPRRIGERLSAHASTLASRPRPRLGRSRWRQNPARQLRRLLRPARRQYDGVAPRRQSCSASDVRKRERNPDRAGADRSARREGSLFTLEPSTAKNRSRAYQVGQYLLTQVKDNQPGLRRKLELDRRTQARDSGQSVTAGRNRHETRRLEVFDAKAVRAPPWEPLIKTVLRLTRIVHRRDAATGL